MAKQKLPETILVYKFEEILATGIADDGTAVYVVATDIEDIPEDAHGELVGEYVLKTTSKFRVCRKLE